MDAVSARLIRDAGTPDSLWVPWLRRQAIRPVPITELCPNGSRLVVVAPHPDDEVLACGGLLTMHAKRGLPSLVVAVTDGEASHGTADLRACAILGARRAEESYAGLRTLGVAACSVVRLGIPDGEAMRYVDAITQKLGSLLKTSDVVVTTWHLDGHPDHEAVAEAARRASIAAGSRLLQAPVWMWHWAEPGDARVPWKDLVALELAETTIQAKQDALCCHQTQLEARGGGLGPVLVSSIRERAARACEYFFQCAPNHAE